MPLTKVNGQMLDGAITADSSGNVGIGTSSPVNKLSLATTANGGFCLNVASRPHFGATYSSDSLVLGYSVKPNPSTVDGMVGTETNSGGGAPAAILMNSGVIQFHTATSVTSGAAFSSERMRITSVGEVLVGTSTVGMVYGGIQSQPNGNTTNVPFFGCAGNSSDSSYISYGLYSTSLSQYQFYVNYNGTIAARSTSITGLSDISEKENIQPLETGLNEVLALQPRRFDWKNGSGQNIAGFVAQEVEAVLPDLVEEYKVDETTTKKGLKMGDMIPTLVKAIQELKAELDATKAEVAELKAKGQ